MKSKQEIDEIAADLIFEKYKYKDGLIYNRKTNKKVSPSPGRGRYGRVQLIIDGKRHTYLYHRVVWLLWYGVWPSKNIDHINRDSTDNRVQNLRDVSQAENIRNASMPKNNSSGHKGVCWNKKNCKWHASIGVNYAKIDLGYYDDILDAVAARKAAESRYW